MSEPSPKYPSLRVLDVPLDRDIFTRTLISKLAGALEDIVGLEDAEGFISVVGRAIGEEIGNNYRSALSLSNLDRDHVAAVLEDLKARIQGDFKIISLDENKIVFENSRCPFGDKVIGRASLCMMTSNVFGTITADNLGYAAVELQETIAKGDKGCRVVVYLKEGMLSDATGPGSREYFGDI